METNSGTAGTTGTSGLEQDTLSGQPNRSGMLDRGKERVRSSVDEGKTRVARTLSTVASSLKTGSTEMQTGDAAAIGGVVERVADQIDRAADYLERSEVDEIVNGVERFARRNPALFIGAAFAVGVLGARFLKSSRTDMIRYEGGMDAPSPYTDREVRTAPVGSADLASSGMGTGTNTGAADLGTGIE